MQRLLFNRTVLLFFIMTAITHDSAAAEFCVYNNIGLQIALDTASTNNQNDVIKIKKGDYIYPVKGEFFRYEADAGEFYDLTISGGWVGGTQTTCSFQNREIYSTSIDGDFQSRGLLVETVDGAYVEITDLNFINGAVATGNDGGGLMIETSNGAVIHTKIERNTFINNLASAGAAFSQNGGNRIDFTNNLVINNHSETGAAVNLESRNQNGVYVINNTIMNNTTDKTAAFESSGLYVFVTDSSEAFIANNILWGNQINDLWVLGYEHLYHNDIGSQTAPADVEVGNLSVTPDFLPYGNAYVPRHNSVLHNTGYHLPTFIHVPPWFEEDWSHSDYDVTGTQIRVREFLVDIGAFETPYDSPIFENGFECFIDDLRGDFGCKGS